MATTASTPPPAKCEPTAAPWPTNSQTPHHRHHPPVILSAAKNPAFAIALYCYCYCYCYCFRQLPPQLKTCHPERSSSRTCESAQSKDLRSPLLLPLPFSCHPSPQPEDLLLPLHESRRGHNMRSNLQLVMIGVTSRKRIDGLAGGRHIR
jgi:hypothetical protein